MQRRTYGHIHTTAKIGNTRSILQMTVSAPDFYSFELSAMVGAPLGIEGAAEAPSADFEAGPKARGDEARRAAGKSPLFFFTIDDGEVDILPGFLDARQAAFHYAMYVFESTPRADDFTSSFLRSRFDSLSASMEPPTPSRHDGDGTPPWAELENTLAIARRAGVPAIQRRRAASRRAGISRSSCTAAIMASPSMRHFNAMTPMPSSLLALYAPPSNMPQHHALISR